MLPLSKSEARIINYLYEHRGEMLYAAEIAKALKLPKRSVYRSLESLEKKEIVYRETRGRMKFYKLSDKWMDIAEAANITIAETGEAITPTGINSSLRRRLKFAIKQIETRIQKLDHEIEHFSKRGKSISAKIKDAYKKDMNLAFVLISEFLSIRKKEKMLLQERYALQKIMDKLQGVSRIEDVATVLGPAIGVLHKIWLMSYSVFPESSKELEQIRNLLNGILIDSSIRQGLSIDFKTVDSEIQKILKDIADTTEQKLQELLKLPTNFQRNMNFEE